LNKKNFHTKGKENIKFIKENTKNLSQEQKDEFIKKYNEDNEKKKKEKEQLGKEKNKNLKLIEKEKLNKILKSLEKELLELKNKYDIELKEIENIHYTNLKLEFDKIDKKNIDNKKLMNEIMDKLNNEFISKNIYLGHEYNRNYSSLITDYNNNIDIKYNEITNKKLNNDKLINELKNKIIISKNELKKLKKDNFRNINKEYEKDKINLDINENKIYKKTLKRLIKKINDKIELLNYETLDNPLLTSYQNNNIIKNIANLLLKIKNMNLSDSLNNYLNSLNNINEYLLLNSKDTIKKTVSICLRYISIINIKNNNSLNIIKVLNNKIKKIKKIEESKTNDYKIKYNIIINELNVNTNEMNKLMFEKNKIEKEIMGLFKDKNNENIKVDNMSKKMLTILNKMNYVVIDPGMNSLLTMLSKDGKNYMSYSKCCYLNKTKRKEILKIIEKIILE
jgi:hypothetical protein